MLKKLIAVMAVMLLTAVVSAAKEAVEVSTGEVVASIDRESTMLYSVAAIKQGYRYYEEYEKAFALEKEIQAKIQALGESNAAEKEKLSTTLAANMQLQAGCLTGYAESLTAVIKYRAPDMAAQDEAKKKLDRIIEGLGSVKEEKNKAKFLTLLETRRVKLAEAKKSLTEMIAQLEQQKTAAEARVAALKQEAVVTTAKIIEAPAVQ